MDSKPFLKMKLKKAMVSKVPRLLIFLELRTESKHVGLFKTSLCRKVREGTTKESKIHRMLARQFWVVF